MSTPVTDLDARYGRTRSSARRTRLVGSLAAAAIVLVFGAWVWWAGILSPSADIGVDPVGYSVGSDAVVTVRYQVTVDPGTAAKCAVQGLDATGGTVGWLVVDVPASQQHTRAFTTTVRTTQRAVTGVVNRCWPTS
ncbi:DUF4307 domain-containing protein [Galbitalea sp. SE-J8]|uniref:DUF4307 domain-containing protein n=1 Tax=Galbitalea sp. SE-J8 TaxID=3054952 RepID=UPI00259CD9EF|nr:DUF4307 domain-containing protein [Galbitalea sp. SE-J8]MDM4763398.1 DUF4307 domain-containing protein [Galbitalea sp. SE-J8]